MVVETCGEHCGVVCLEKLKKSLHVEHTEDLHIIGFNTFHKLITQKNHVADVVISEIDNELITFIYPLDEKIKQQLLKYEIYNLTASELKIVSRLVLGQSNQTIADALFISKATLKKHINNIYKKIPEKLRPRSTRS